MLDTEPILQLIARGIISKISTTTPIAGAIEEGMYIGCPGKDIYLIIHGLSKKRFKTISQIIAKAIAEQFPFKPPIDHIGQAACIRYIYGCDHRGGILSKADSNHLTDQNWEIGDQFMSLVFDEFKSTNNYYGMTVYYEMRGHRLGDLAVQKQDKQKLDECIDSYLSSHRLAIQCRSDKHIFSSLYWAGKYLYKMNDPRHQYFFFMTLWFMDLFCPAMRDGYMGKAHDCMRLIKETVPANDWETYKQIFPLFSHPIIKKTLKKDKIKWNLI